MNEKLTLSDCFKYPNAKIKGDSRMFNSVLNYLRYYTNPILQEKFISDCKLMLRSIESLTEAEKEMIAEITKTPFLFGNDIDGLIEYLDFSVVVELINYLRSINIDIDGFIELRKAVAE